MLKTISRWLLPAFALVALVFAIITVIPRPQKQTEPVLPPAAAIRQAGQGVVAALGVVEPASEVIAIATELPGLVREVHVRPDQTVAEGEPLFSLDLRDINAQRASLAADVQAAQARLDTARAQIATASTGLAAARADAASARAGIVQAQANEQDVAARARRFDTISDPRAVSADERDRAGFALEQARARTLEISARADAAAANVDRAQSLIAEANARAAEAQASLQQATKRLAIADTTRERLVVRAPMAGRVLRVNVRPGEYAPAGPLANPLMTMGGVGPLMVRAEVDEEDIARVGPKASASLRGNGQQQFALTFVRTEPQARPKRNLAGGGERIDTRVVEVLFALPEGIGQVYIGQQMDVFIEAPPLLGPNSGQPGNVGKQAKGSAP